MYEDTKYYETNCLTLNIINKTIITKNIFFKISIKLGGSACSGARMS